MDEKRLTIMVDPRPKERPQGRVAYTKEKKPFVQMYTPAATKKYEEEIRKVWIRTHGNTPMEGPLLARVYCYFRIPKSDTKAKKAAKLNGEYREEIRDDVDNCGKAVMDALNKVAYNDDKQIIKVLAVKNWAEVGHVTVIISKYQKKEEKTDDVP
jgi:Holliday junction resolvase RusA-like endonuclease